MFMPEVEVNFCIQVKSEINGIPPNNYIVN